MLKFWALILLSLSAFAQEDLSTLAHSPDDAQIIHRPHYDLSYNNQHEVANWVAYSLDHSKLRSCHDRQNNFRADPEIVGGSAALEDYSGSGYDRGHLLPAGDMKFDREAMSATFFLSNMTPQPARFNRGRWALLEGLIRAWALKYGKIWVVTGPVLKGRMSSIGRVNRISVPEDYYKVVLRKDVKGWKGTAFLMNTSVPYSDLNAYAVTIDEVEELSGIDFFPNLPSETQEDAEAQNEQADWDYTARFNYLPCSTSVTR